MNLRKLVMLYYYLIVQLQREAGFEHVAIEANKWAGVVQERKRADQLHFPLEKVDLRVITSEKNYKPLIKTDLEKMVYELLDGTALETQEKVVCFHKNVQKHTF